MKAPTFVRFILKFRCFHHSLGPSLPSGLKAPAQIGLTLKSIKMLIMNMTAKFLGQESADAFQAWCFYPWIICPASPHKISCCWTHGIKFISFLPPKWSSHKLQNDRMWKNSIFSWPPPSRYWEYGFSLTFSVKLFMDWVRPPPPIYGLVRTPPPKCGIYPHSVSF